MNDYTLNEDEFDQLSSCINGMVGGIMRIQFNNTSKTIVTVLKGENFGNKSSIELFFHTHNELDSSTLSKIPNLRRYGSCHCLEMFGIEYHNCYTLSIASEGIQGDVASFIIYELYKNDIENAINPAFVKCASLIKMLTEDNSTGLSKVLGLVGELYFLNEVLEIDATLDVAKIWYGYEKSNRDFNIKNFGIEVKTTTSPDAKHYISSLKQVTPCNNDSEVGGVERGLFLLSLSFIPYSSEVTQLSNRNITLYSLYSLINAIKSKITSETSLNIFLKNVQTYLNMKNTQEDIFMANLKDDRLLSMNFRLRHSRFYDMYDFENIKIFRDGHLSEYPHLDQSSLKFTINFPERITPDNPKTFIEGLGTIINL